MRTAFVAALTALFIPLSAGGQEAANNLPGRIVWTVDSAARTDGNVQLQLSYGSAHEQSINSRGIEMERLEGLSRAQLDGDGSTPVHFRLGRDAGAFDCDGAAWHGHGTGECRFQANTGFAAAMVSRGYGAPTLRQSFSLTLADIGLAYVDELQRQHYARANIDQLVEAGDHGVHLTYLQEMGRLGYRAGSLEGLIRMRDHGVHPDFIQALVQAGLANLPTETLIEMRDHGVSPTYIGELRQLGYSNLPVRELIQLRDHGITLAYVHGLAGAGISRLPLEELVRLRDHGVTPEFAAALRSSGYSGVSPSDMVRLRDYGVTADFLRTASTGGRRLSVDELIRLRSGG
jgi:hypothetical protein